MKIAIIGSRSLTNVDISKYVPEGTTEIITGGAKGIDSLAEKYADENGIPKTIIKPNYKRYKRGAPLKRNEEIVQLADKIIALWNGRSRGTKFTIDYANRIGKEVKVYVFNEQTEKAQSIKEMMADDPPATHLKANDIHCMAKRKPRCGRN